MSKTFTTKNNEYKAYTYLVGWSNLNKYYYGVRYSRKSNPNNFWKDYFTSSEYVKEYREKYGEPDIIQVRKEFDNPNDAMNWETRVLKRLLRSSNPKRNNWLNVCIGQNEFSISDECIEKISKARRNYIMNRTDEQKQRDYESRKKAGANEESRKKISEKAKERFANPEYRKHFEDNVWNNEEYKNKLRESTTKWLSDPIEKEKWLKTVQSEEYRNKQGEDSKNRLGDPEYKKRWVESLAKAKENPDYYKNKSENAKKSTGTRLASRALKELSDGDIISMSEDDYIEYLKTKIKSEYSFDHSKVLSKFNERKNKIN